MNAISNMLAVFLENAARQLRNDECGLTDNELESLFHQCQCLLSGMITKYEACEMLHVSRATFDRLVLSGRIPKGMSRRGSHELYWNKFDIDKYQRECFE